MDPQGVHTPATPTRPLLAATLRTPLGDHDLLIHVFRGGTAAVCLSAAPAASVLTQGRLRGRARNHGAELLLDLGGATPLRLPHASAEAATAAAAAVNAAAALPATLLTVDDMAARIGAPGSVLSLLRPLRHITDVDALAPEQAALLREQLLRATPPPSGYLMVPLPDGVWVLHREEAAGQRRTRAVSGNIPVVAWAQGQAEGATAEAADMQTLLGQLRAKAEPALLRWSGEPPVPAAI